MEKDFQNAAHRSGDLDGLSWLHPQIIMHSLNLMNARVFHLTRDEVLIPATSNTDRPAHFLNIKIRCFDQIKGGGEQRFTHAGLSFEREE